MNLEHRIFKRRWVVETKRQMDLRLITRQTGC